MSRLALIVGHDDKRKGASLHPPYSFVQEYEFNTVLAAMIIRKSTYFQNLEARVFLRDGRTIKKTYAEVESWGPQACVELHFNAFAGKASGSTVLFGDVPNSNLLAHEVQIGLVKALGNTDRGLSYVDKDARGGGNVNNGVIPKVLIEPFFGSDQRDTENVLDHMPQLAMGILTGAALFMNALL